MHNFSSAMSMTSGFLYLKEKLPSIWAWVPLTVQDKLDVLVTLYQDQKLIREREIAITEEPVIPFIGLYFNFPFPLDFFSHLS